MSHYDFTSVEFKFSQIATVHGLYYSAAEVFVAFLLFPRLEAASPLTRSTTVVRSTVVVQQFLVLKRK